MRRRELIALLGSSAVILPRTTFAQMLLANADLSGYRNITETNNGRIKWWK
jgi:hypothetical protein